jgi:hypothetical protein
VRLTVVDQGGKVTPDYLCLSTNLTSTEAAAWVQAIGSILAIAAAILISWRQSKLARESLVNAQVIADKARQHGILAIAEAALEHARRIDEALLQTESGSNPTALYEVYDQTIINGMVQALTDVPAHEVGSRDAVIALLSLRDQFRFLGKAIEDYKKPKNDPDITKLLDSTDPGEERQKVWSQLKTVLAKNARDRVVIIRKQYESLKNAIDRAGPESQYVQQGITNGQNPLA